MKGRLITACGTVYELPALLYARIRRTGGVPCDSFEVRCLYGAEMVQMLEAAHRFEAVENGTVVFRGVIDEWSAALRESGRLLTLTGRGMAALLLDSDTETAVYQWAGMREIVRRYVTPSGVACELPEERYGVEMLRVNAGASRWRAVETFCARCALEPYFTADGTLRFSPRGTGERRALGVPDGVIEAHWRDRRYGVLSAVTAVNSATGERVTVRNDAFIARGGQCERVLYGKTTPVQAAREGLEESTEGARELVLTLASVRSLEPRERVSLRLPALGLTGDFRVNEVAYTLSTDGEMTKITLWEE